MTVAVGGLVRAPYTPTVIALPQRRTTPATRTRALATNTAVAAVSVPLGTLPGGPLVTAIGARPTLLCSACGIIAWGLLRGPGLRGPAAASGAEL